MGSSAFRVRASHTKLLPTIGAVLITLFAVPPALSELVVTRVSIGGCESLLVCGSGGPTPPGSPFYSYLDSLAGGGNPVEIQSPKGGPLYMQAIAQLGLLAASASVVRPGGLLPPYAGYPNDAFSGAVATSTDAGTLFPTSGPPPNPIATVRVNATLSGTYSNDPFPRGRTYLETTIRGEKPFRVQYPNPGATLLYAFPVGAYIEVTQLLSVLAELRSNDTVGSEFADFTHTGRLFIDVVTPGYKIVWASGHDYSTPVPEPGGGLLLAVGCAAMWARWRSLGLRAAGR